MNGPAWTLTASLLLLALGVRGAPAAAEEPGNEPAAASENEATAEATPAMPEKEGPQMSPEARVIGDPDHPDSPPEEWFGPGPSYDDHAYDAEAQLAIYGAKHMNPTAEPPIQLGRRLYDRGEFTARPTWLGEKNPLAAHFMVYGDLRTAAVYNDDGVAGANGETHQSTVAVRLNLDVDLGITATERIHLFVRPFDQGGSTLRYELDGRVEDEFVEEFDFNVESLFFEGDVGSIATGLSDEPKKVDLPFALGLVPIVAQNGVWIEDAVTGLAFAWTARNSPSLDISNFDLTFFAGFDRVTTDAVIDDNDANLYGLAGFMDLLEGYLEFGYGYVDAEFGGLGYHNATAAFSKRYGRRLSNSVRVIGNFGQEPDPGLAKTADGVLVLLENSLITHKPSTLIPYINLFAGWDTPQSLARAAGSGGVLRNTGINFETDGMTGFPTLDARGHDSYGGAVGVEYLFNLDRQLVVEAAAVERMEDSVLGSEYALGIRFQEPLSNAWILRLDAMAGWRDLTEDVFGARLEIRRKF
jgi:hypothetical protein